MRHEGGNESREAEEEEDARAEIIKSQADEKQDRVMEKRAK